MRRRPGQAGPCAPGLWASAPPQMRLRIGPRSLRIGPSGKQQPLGKARPGPTRQSGQKPKGSASHPRRRFYRNGGRMGRCSLPVRSGKGKQQPQGKENQAAPLPRERRERPPTGRGNPPANPPTRPSQAHLQAGQIIRPAPSAALSAGRLGGGGKRGGRPALWRVSRPSLSLFLGVFLCSV